MSHRCKEFSSSKTTRYLTPPVNLIWHIPDNTQFSNQIHNGSLCNSGVVSWRRPRARTGMHVESLFVRAMHPIVRCASPGQGTIRQDSSQTRLQCALFWAKSGVPMIRHDQLLHCLITPADEFLLRSTSSLVVDRFVLVKLRMCESMSACVFACVLDHCVRSIRHIYA